MNMVKLTVGCGWAVLLVACLGCGGQPDVYKVEGTLSYKGTPLPDVTVLFTPVDGSRRSSAQTDENGHFKMRYTGTVDGAVPGEHLVYLQYIPPNAEEGMAVLEGRAKVKGMMGEVLEKYGSAEVSDYHVTVDQDFEDLKIDLQ